MKFSFLALLLTILSASAIGASAASEAVAFPVAELGGCADKDACFAYCEEAEHHEACIAFGKANGLLTDEEIDRFERANAALADGPGPGGCASESSCKEYCAEVAHMSECLVFARENGLMSREELAEAEKVASALANGLSMPGGCSNQQSCEAYCENPSNADACLTFAESAGLRSAEEVTQIRASMSLMGSGEAPGGCRDREACESYCEDEAHAEECVEFAVKAGFMSEEDGQRRLDSLNGTADAPNVQPPPKPPAPPTQPRAAESEDRAGRGEDRDSYREPGR